MAAQCHALHQWLIEPRAQWLLPSSCPATFHRHSAETNPLLAAAQVWDLRKLQELRTFRGHTKDVLCAGWHPVHEELFASGGHDGGLLYWLASRPGPQARP